MSNAEQRAEVPSEVATVLPTGAGHTQAVVKSLEGSITDIKTDIREIRNAAETNFRLLFGALIAVALGLAGVIAKGFHWL